MEVGTPVQCLGHFLLEKGKDIFLRLGVFDNELPSLIEFVFDGFGAIKTKVSRGFEI